MVLGSLWSLLHPSAKQQNPYISAKLYVIFIPLSCFIIKDDEFGVFTVKGVCVGDFLCTSNCCLTVETLNMKSA